MMRLTLPLLVLLAALAAPAALAQGGRVEIGLSPTPPPAGLPVDATIQFLDTRPQSATLHIRTVGESTYQQLPAADQGDGLWLVDVPFVFPAQGVEVFASFVLDGQTITEPVQNPEGDPFRIPAFIAAITSDISLPSRGYRMVTVPVVLGADSGFPEELGSDNPVDVLGATFGASGDPALWRASRWNEREQRYRDAVQDPAAVRIQPGRGFWLVTSQGGTFQVAKGISAGVSFEGDTPRAAPVVVPLQTGWNQIGNPYLFPIQWSSVERSTGVEDPVAFAGTYNGGQATLRPWEGYFVFNSGPPSELRFRVRPGAPARTDNRPLAERMRDRAGDSASVLEVTAQSGGLEDAIYLGLGAAASTEAPVNLHKPPAIEGGLRLSAVADGDDWIGRFEGEAGWTLALEANSDVTLRLRSIGDWPNVVLEDVDRSVALAVTGGVVRVPALEGVASRTIRVRLEGDTDGPSLAPSFGTPRPNPTAGRVTLPFALSTASAVEVEVVDVLGRVVRRVLEDDLEAGSHIAEWDGLDGTGAPAAAGVYLIRLRSDLGSSTVRITRLR